MAPIEYHHLTPDQRTHFLTHGWVLIPSAIPPEHIEHFASDIWIRLGYDPNDKSTWVKEKVHNPRHREMKMKEFMPEAWGAICEILGGEERIDESIWGTAGDSLICNFGSEEWENRDIDPRDPGFGDWHTDGDWFKRFLDSPEQALQLILLFTDVVPRGGPTYIAEDGLAHMTKWLHDHPEGCDKGLLNPDGSRARDAVKDWTQFVPLTGKAGDVIIIHPFMPHSASRNHLRIPRFITNPPVTLKEPFNYNRANPEDYSLVELKTLRSLGVTSLPDWKIMSERKRFPPTTGPRKNALIQEQLERMKEHARKTGGMVNSMHLNTAATATATVTT
jgi:hypothetical protein